MALDPEKVHEGESDLKALRDFGGCFVEPTEVLRKRLEWLMPLGGVTDELVALRKALWRFRGLRRHF